MSGYKRREGNKMGSNRNNRNEEEEDVDRNSQGRDRENQKTNDQIADYLYKVALRHLSGSELGNKSAGDFMNVSRRVKDLKNERISSKNLDQIRLGLGLGSKSDEPIGPIIMDYISGDDEVTWLSKMHDIPKVHHFNDDIIQFLNQKLGAGNIKGGKFTDVYLNAIEILKHLPKRITIEQARKLKGVGTKTSGVIADYLQEHPTQITNDEIADYLETIGEGFGLIGDQKEEEIYLSEAKKVRQYEGTIRTRRDAAKANITSGGVQADIEEYVADKPPAVEIVPALNAYKKSGRRKTRKTENCVEKEKNADLLQFLDDVSLGLELDNDNTWREYADAAELIRKYNQVVTNIRDVERARVKGKYTLGDIQDFLEGMSLISSIKRALEKGKEEREKRAEEERKGIIELREEVSRLKSRLAEMEKEPEKGVEKEEKEVEKVEKEINVNIKDTPELSAEAQEQIGDITSVEEALRLDLKSDDKLLVYWSSDLSKITTDKHVDDIKEALYVIGGYNLKPVVEDDDFTVNITINDTMDEFLSKMFVCNRGSVFDADNDITIVFGAFAGSTVRLLRIRI